MDFALIWFNDLASERICIVRKCALISTDLLMSFKTHMTFSLVLIKRK